MKRIRNQITLLLIVTTLLAACSPGLLNLGPVISGQQPTAVAVSTLPANTASIGGVLWHDICMLSGGEGGVPIQPSAGCIPSQEGGFQANGIREAEDTGLGGILVSVGYGACGEADDYIEVKTNPDGSYAFTNLAAGQYCVVVDSLRPENGSLLPGQWTSPEDDTNTGTLKIEVNLGHGEQRADVNFGWDYQFLPMPPAAESAQPLVRGRVNAQGLNLRVGPGIRHLILRQLDEGTELELQGRSENLEWLLVRLPNGTQGWVSHEFVDTQAVIASLPLKEAYGGPDLAPSNGGQDVRQPMNVQVSIENNAATVIVSGFPGDSQVNLMLGEAGGRADLQVGSGVTTENGNAVIRFNMPSHWPDGKPLASGNLTLVASSAAESITVNLQYYRN